VEKGVHRTGGPEDYISAASTVAPIGPSPGVLARTVKAEEAVPPSSPHHPNACFVNPHAAR